MSKWTRTRNLLAVGAVMLAVAPAARAVTIGYSLSGDSQTIEMSNGLDATVALDVYSVTIDLTPGVSSTELLNPGDLDVFQGANASGDGSLSQTLTITGATPASQSIDQTFSITTTAANPPFDPASASIFVSSASPLVFALPGYTLTVTPLFEVVNGQTSTSIVFSNTADFLLTAVPEPTTATATLAGGALLLARRRRRD